MKKSNFQWQPGITVLLCLFMFSCRMPVLFENYGQIASNQEITALFENFSLKPELNYYISGSDVYPHAIIGIKKQYTLQSQLWKKVDFNPQSFKRLIQNMESKTWDFHTKPQGFDIIDKAGNQIGIWYSIIDARTSVKTLEENRIVIDTPPIDTYEKLEQRYDSKD